MMATMDPNMAMPATTSTASSTEADMSGPLSTAGVDFSDPDQKADFLEALLDDTELQVTSNHFATYFWYGIVVVIGIAAILNLYMRLKSRSRLRAAREGNSSSHGLLSKSANACTSLTRKLTYRQLTSLRHTKLFSIPPLGTLALLITYFAFVLGLNYAKQDIQGLQHDESLGLRAGWLTIAQMPLLILLAGKINLIGLVTGLSYERLNILHRWVARCMLLTATLHWTHQHALWARLGNGLVTLEWETDACFRAGVVAYSMLLWMNLSTLFPIRNARYEIFILQHILSFIAVIVTLMLHLPDTALYTRVYIWIPIGLVIFDRLIRSSRYAYLNIRPGRATLTRLPCGMTKIVVKNKQLKKWTPGSFILLGLPRYGIAQSHPATIISIPSSDRKDLVFLLKAQGGFTKRINEAASPLTFETDLGVAPETHLALLDGPYGGTHLDFASFDTLMLIAGSSGCTFTLPILLSIAERSRTNKFLPVKKIVFIWAIQTTACRAWIEDELVQVASMCKDIGIQLDIKIHVTRNTEFVRESGSESMGEKYLVEKIDSGIHQMEAPPSPSASQLQVSSGRPDVRSILNETHQLAIGEMGVAVCGPLGLRTEVGNGVAALEGRGKGVYLHVEGFGW